MAKKNITNAVIVHCIDFRLQKGLDIWIKKNYGYGNYDRVSLAGGVFDFEHILKQIEISAKLHDVNQIILVNHEDCGAYGVEGNYERHKSDLEKAKGELGKIFPTIETKIFYLHLGGKFEEIIQI
ncbi:MAG: hypothetical protein HN392_10995 [Anaerolineae bacterium]|jgi:carbonic anhydrase|nr:hypothetical protein [Anaerolineae bacterium]MBT7074203.1 hypothetical protein [Anaerolineae bacterium]MBT7781856.1 hypothetical protein [Anaerolineae bacterium]